MFWRKSFTMCCPGSGICRRAIRQRSRRQASKGNCYAGSQDTAAKTSAASFQRNKAVQRPKSYDLGAMDKGVDPCQDFYQYACGTWRKNNPIPSDQSRWGRFNELADYNRQFLHTILEKAAANDPKRTPVMQKIGDMYQSCMDETKINAEGKAPLKPELDRIAAITSKDQLIETIGYLHTVGVPALFGFGAGPDLHNASVEIANISQGGLGLPDRDYYSETDAKSVETRQKYQEHMANMFVLLGDDEAKAKAEAQTVMDIETKLADAAFKRVMMRDPKNRDHKMKVAELTRPLRPISNLTATSPLRVRLPLLKST